MLFFLVTGTISFIFFLNSLPLKPLPPWTHDMRLLPLCFWKDMSFSLSPSCKSIKKGIFGSIVAMKQDFTSSSKVEHVELNEQFLSLLDLPELALDCILEKLSPVGLRNMSGVCTSLRSRCVSNYLWERHMKYKWGDVLGSAAYREWQCFIASRQSLSNSNRKKTQGFMKYLLPVSWFVSKFDKPSKVTSSPLVDSVMSWYLALESGKFWFPAQVYNRENGHVGFMLSCYDAELSYDSQSDTFHARYPPHGRRAVAIESGVQWERLRVAPVETSPHDLHVSDCLNDLHPGDHIEIQWRRNKEFPYGWWYGVVGHLETCDRNENYCRCKNSDTVVLEFNQYTPGSRWRTTNVNRKDHREEGNETDGFYGGIRKVYKDNEIATWKRLWPREILE
ncbi:F-box protein At2g32560-like [Silene latifolia]|uniref:F-box protein At2g32560-like n=1 Tax=Silene latifolia TaxID=37657 RepID=UPI003D77929B